MKNAHRICFLALAVICGLTIFTACGAKDPNAFITMKKMSDSTKVIRLGMSQNQIFAQVVDGIYNVGMERGNSISLKYEDSTVQNCVAIISYGNGFQTDAGLSYNNKLADVLPIYQKDPDIVIVSNEAAKVVLSKQINGVNYAMAVRAYDNGDIKDITIYNADLYTDNDADYQ